MRSSFSGVAVKRNPPWTRDELILALDLYFRVNPLKTSEKNPEIVKASTLLNKLPIHRERPDVEKFRNPSGVYMKLCNLLRLDPSYKGVGLKAGSQLDKVVWDEYATDKDNLRAVAEAILKNYDSRDAKGAEKSSQISEEDEFPEGKVLRRVHLARERSARLVKKKKQLAMERSGRLACEVCGFDFLKVYGSIGEGFIECHHIVPLSKLRKSTRTTMKDLALVCANCHRMLHRIRPWMSIQLLRNRLQNS